jgi:putative flippase GtrA
MEGSLWLHSGLFIVGLAVIGWWISSKEMLEAMGSGAFNWKDERARLTMTIGLLLAAVLVNAFVCGALSGPFARYQARITWLVALGASMAVISTVPARLRLPAWAVRLRAHPLVAAFERRFDFAFLRFGLVGTAGFLVHASVLNLMVYEVGVNRYIGWVAGFSVAVVATLLLNRAFTFRRPSHHGPWRQAAIYLAVQGFGAAANFATYTAAIALFPPLGRMLVIPLALGSIAGLCLNFLGSKHLAFRPAKGVEPPEAAEPST